MLMASMAMSNCVPLIMLCIDLYLNIIRKPASRSTLAVSYQAVTVLSPNISSTYFGSQKIAE
ncbi:hypothetical protein PRIPAC_78671 [Pristionchus pacificus]|uniref:Uncharacterized protein n=1 Tax=Pristionchus pacificus TaxID=54126 RepID=A0A2A6C3Y0_PRIPA|nr:hypothetical protein PRIPAC_78671 [Pristionchus pacificus]|eukprot:PDM72753.1 hypothetical protein PRIPAC_39187 [Pristionchus pacificus]